MKLHADAVLEAIDARKWYSDLGQDLLEAFSQELDRAISKVATSPGRWPQHLRGTRCFLLRRFPYLVIYREINNDVEVIAIAHTSRRPGYWAKRL